MNSNSESSADHGALRERLSRETEGEVAFGAFDRGRYATDASFYQIEPIGVVIPKTENDLRSIIQITHEEDVALLPRGGATSQSGQTVGRALVVDCSKYLREIVAFDADARTCTVQPGLVLDDLNRALKPHGLWYPIDVSTSSRATIGGMAGNNSCGTRSIRYGIMRDRVMSIDALLHDGTHARFGDVTRPPGDPGGEAMTALTDDLLRLGATHEALIASRYPDVSRRVGGYNLDALLPGATPVNLAKLLVGSEGTLAVSRRIDLELAPLPVNKVLGVCHFPAFRKAMEAAKPIVELGPVAVEVVDRNLIELALDIPMFARTMQRFVRGEPEALLLVEFAEDNQVENLRRLKLLDELMSDLGHRNSVVEAIGTDFQAAVWEVRKSGLNIMMSMKSDGKPVSFVEDCAVPLEHLPDYTERLTAVFARHGTTGTWYAHASAGCLHVRPILNLKLESDADAMRAIAEEAFEMVREYKGAHSGEHGDGLVRSEFHQTMYGPEMVGLFEQVKDRIDPSGRMNPGKIVRAPSMNDRRLFRYKPDYSVPELQTALDWSAFTGAGGGFQGAVEMCNNNGACRKFDAGVMCPSYRVTRNERDLTRGRANTLRLAISGQLGPGALTSPDMRETMKYCVSCKACRRECPTGVDMAKMKIEVLHANARRHGVPLHDRMVAELPRYAPWARALAPLLNLRNRATPLAWAGERLAGFSARRSLPRWRRDAFREDGPFGPQDGAPVILFADTFNRWFEPENIRAAIAVLTRAGYRVHVPKAGGRPPCCGRTYLSAGMVDRARSELERLVTAIADAGPADAAVVGLEPSCLFTLHDEIGSLLPHADTAAITDRAMMLEQFLAREDAAGRLDLDLEPLNAPVRVHGHCHQKSFDAMGDVQHALGLVPGADVSAIQSGCCGMAGAFGYGAGTYDISMQMGELALLPAVRDAEPGTVIVADGFSCRHQIRDGTGIAPLHAARFLERQLVPGVTGNG